MRLYADIYNCLLFVVAISPALLHMHVGHRVGLMGHLPAQFLLRLPKASAPLRSPRFLFGSKCSPGDDLSSIKRVVFLNSGIATQVLEEFMSASIKSEAKSKDREGDGEYSFKVVGLVTNPTQGYALTPDGGSKEFIRKMELLKPDLCVCVSYGMYFSEQFLSMAPYGTLNIHPSLLPKYRGPAPVQSCILSGDKTTGVTVVKVTPEIDAGPILSQTKLELTGNEKTSTLLPRLLSQGVRDLVKALPSVWDGSATYLEQNTECASYVGKFSKSTDVSFCNFTSESALEIHRKVCAFDVWPGCWTYFYWDALKSPVKVKLLTTKVVGEEGSDLPVHDSMMCGSSNAVRFCKSRNALELTCADGSILRILELMLQSRKPTDATSFYNGIHKAALFWAPLDSSHLSSSTTDTS